MFGLPRAAWIRSPRPPLSASVARGVGHCAVDVVDVSKSGNIGPVLGEDSLAELVPLDLEAALPACSLEAEVDPADAGE